MPSHFTDPAAPGECRVVAIAASGGGLEALRALLGGLPETCRLCLVIAHPPASPARSLVDVLAPWTALRVVSLATGQRPAQGTLYVTPPGRDAVLTGGRFELVEPQDAAGPGRSADTLFRSLADELGERAIGIVLSGTGSDGAAGVHDLRAAGGLTIAQDPASARPDELPRAAIDRGGVDLVLRPDEIGPLLLRQASGDLAPAAPDGIDADADLYDEVARLVRARTAFRLDEYKAGTVRRRIARRIGLLNLGSLADYVDHLRHTPDEAQQLVRDTFISVTSFFRDADAYLALQRALGELVRRTRTGVVRCWVPGCATGEEAYSIAMLLEEALRVEERADLQYLIFASDLDDDALELARGATYALHTLSELPPALHERYVETQGNVGRVLKRIRNRVVFARQNLIDDPPFSRMDLISCRNLLIYLNPPVQQRVLEVFHYALRPGGQLFLGRSESADVRTDLYAPVDPHARLYVRREGAGRYALPSDKVGTRVAVTGQSAGARGAESSVEIGRLMQEQLVQRYAPPSLVVDDAGSILHFQGALKPFLDFPSGRAGMHLFDMVDPAVRAELHAQVYRTRRERNASQGSAHTRPIDGIPHEVRVRVEALDSDDGGLMLVSFLARPVTPSAAPAQAGETPEAEIVAELEQELATARSHLSVVVEELATSKEELQSLTEELQSTNEALHSSNEELQTSNEELQSTNEELRTSNEELQAKSSELEATAALLTNVKQSLDFPLLVVDEQRRILDANAACAALVYHDGPLRGVSINAVPWRFPVGDIEREMREVLGSGQRQVMQQPVGAGRQYQLHLMPFRQGPARIAGVVMLFEDVTAVREAVAARLDSDSRYRQVTESLPQLVWTCTAEGPCDYLSPQWVAYTGIPEADQLGYAWLDQLHPDDRQRAIDHWS
ncbi:MAG: PAS domain-containing protein, partial [Ideonella sp.]|nr:PAS domain-containing protein [Ideonella sp.]